MASTNSEAFQDFMLLPRSLHASKAEILPFELKGSLFTLTVMHLFHLEHAVIESHLLEKVKQAPGFFNNTPVVIDLEGMTEAKQALDFERLYALLRRHGLIPVGIRNGSLEYQEAALLAGLPMLPERRSNTNGLNKKTDLTELATSSRNRIVKQPVRSGQEVYAPDGDLIVLGAVSAGADVIADGNIHIYGALRGRALAGVKGNIESWIFCQSLEAELISIAGHYQVCEQFNPTDLAKAAQICLREERLIIEHLTR
jgi:septum site-determining protein MinC